MLRSQLASDHFPITMTVIEVETKGLLSTCGELTKPYCQSRACLCIMWSDRGGLSEARF